ncbi:ClpXP protease specificity-enhancing factor SspB [Thermodesulfovibrio hydrogeniphilus]
MINISEELIRRLNELKKKTFFEILDLVGRVFIVVDYDERVVIGKRGFLSEEKERGLVLVFNNNMKFDWHDEAITATLVFGNTPEKCYIPIDAIATVFSPELRVQLNVPVFRLQAQEIVKQDTEEEAEKDEGDKKIIDITKMRKKK